MAWAQIAVRTETAEAFEQIRGVIRTNPAAFGLVSQEDQAKGKVPNVTLDTTLLILMNLFQQAVMTRAPAHPPIPKPGIMTNRP